MRENYKPDHQRTVPLKDFVYVLILLGLIITVILACALYNDKTLGQEIDFGGMLLSIVLALIAIFYTFQQGESSRRDSTHIVDAVANLNILVNQSSTDIKHFADELPKLRNISYRLEQLTRATELLEGLSYQLGQAQEDAKELSSETKPLEVEHKDDFPSIQYKTRLKRLIQNVESVTKQLNKYKDSQWERTSWSVLISWAKSHQLTEADIVQLISSLEDSFEQHCDGSSSTIVRAVSQDARTIEFQVEFRTTPSLHRHNVKQILDACELPTSFFVLSFDQQQ